MTEESLLRKLCNLPFDFIKLPFRQVNRNSKGENILFYDIAALKAQAAPFLSFIIKNCLRAIDFMGGNHQVHQKDPLNFHENDSRKIKLQLLLRTMKTGGDDGGGRKGENYQAVVLRLCSMFISLRRFTVVALDCSSSASSPGSGLFFFLFGES
jgi:hypothetical protein